MEKQIKTKRGVLGVCVVALFIVAVLTFPYAFNLTWALPGVTSDRTLTYTTGQLTWDSAADVDDTGTIRLNLFKNSYDGASVVSPDGENIVAPNTSNSKNVRLTNNTGNEIQYTAVLYRVDDSPSSIQGELVGGSAATEYTLPQSVDPDKVVNAIGGTVQGNNTLIMAVDWAWQLYTSDENDLADTNAGSDTENTNVTYGLYITVTEPDPEPDPGNTNTNNTNNENTNNGNENGNSNTNTNGNENTNGNTNTNGNENGNTNTNTNGNENTNTNGNGNWNTHNWNINNQNWNTDNWNINNTNDGLIDDIINQAENVKNDSSNALSGLLNRNTNTSNRSTRTINTTTGLTNRNTNANTGGSSTRIVTPTTGDNSRSALLFALALACLCAIMAIIIQKPAKHRAEKLSGAGAQTSQSKKPTQVQPAQTVAQTTALTADKRIQPSHNPEQSIEEQNMHEG